MSAIKKCNQCSNIKEFYINKSGKCSSYCKDCMKYRVKIYYINNPGKLKENNRKRNYSSYKEYNKNYYINNNNPLVNIWKGIIARCYNVNNKSYKNYGGRGIKVCDNWHNKDNFINDMTKGYVKGLQIERINNRFLSFKGLNMLISDWAKYLGISENKLSKRFYNYKWDVEKCLTYNLT